MSYNNISRVEPSRDTEIIALRAEVEQLKAMNALMAYAAWPTDDDAREAEEWIRANPDKPLSDYCSPGGLLVKQLRAENERLRAALKQLAQLDDVSTRVHASP